MDVGNNVLHAGSSYVAKAKENDPVDTIQVCTHSMNIVSQYKIDWNISSVLIRK